MVSWKTVLHEVFTEEGCLLQKLRPSPMAAAKRLPKLRQFLWLALSLFVVLSLLPMASARKSPPPPKKSHPPPKKEFSPPPKRTSPPPPPPKGLSPPLPKKSPLPPKKRSPPPPKKKAPPPPKKKHPPPPKKKSPPPPKRSPSPPPKVNSPPPPAPKVNSPPPPPPKVNASPPPPAGTQTLLGGCQVFPLDNAWNLRVDSLPVAANSAQLVSSIGSDAHAHPDFGSGLYDGGTIGIPYNLVNAATPTYSLPFDYQDESDLGPYPIPAGYAIESGGDRHVLSVDTDTCTLYELYDVAPDGSGGFTAGSGAVWKMSSNHLRPATWTSADAAGLQILPGLARYAEVAAGRITHALRFTARRTRSQYVWPARHQASRLDDASLPPMGLRVRLKQSFDTSKFPPQTKVVLQALKEYGMMLADNGSPWFISGEPNDGWDNDDLHSLHGVFGTSFEVVDMSSVPKPE
eukprot:jgi/Mesen1/7348/ME000377S06566